MITLDEALEDVSILGAAGKMGRGIALLMTQELGRLKAEKGKEWKGVLRLIDSDEDALQTLTPYLKQHLLRYAERMIGRLRTYYAEIPHLVSNGEIIDYFIEQSLAHIRLHTESGQACQSKLIFEAIVEESDVKAQVLSQYAATGAYILSNTSSIPIEQLNSDASLNNRVIGFHFYNPPAVQKLVELITTPHTDPHLKELCKQLGKRLGKKVVHSNDVAGFIGNGHFMRDLLFACNQVKEITKNHSEPSAISILNTVTELYMVRPMGIFQLIDYVGIDVCQKILKVMSTHIEGESFHAELIDQMVAAGIIGGQHPDGSQKAGFFQYQKGKPNAVYDRLAGEYKALDGQENDEALRALPKGHFPWKALSRDRGKEEKLKQYFTHLFAETSFPAQLAQSYLMESKHIAHTLVKQGVAHHIDDVNAVIENGFYHLYGPENTYF